MTEPTNLDVGASGRIAFLRSTTTTTVTVEADDAPPSSTYDTPLPKVIADRIAAYERDGSTATEALR